VFPNRTRYLEVVPHERLVYLHDTGVDDDPKGFHVTVTFTARGGETEIRMVSLFATREAVEEVKKFGAVEMGQQTMRKLAEWLAARG
jgi:uncharacterized protein YndB with AHSA1/START domain